MTINIKNIIFYNRNDTTHLNHQVEETNTRLSKYEKRVIEFEEQNVKHNDLHERMKERLKQMTMEMEEKNEIVKKNYKYKKDPF